MQGAAACLVALLLGLAALPATAQTPVVEAKNADEAAVWQVNEDGGLLGLGVFNTGVIPAEGAGTRLMWHPAKAAFRAGRVGVGSLSDGTEWDEANVGVYSVAFGRGTEASGDASTAMGEETTASGSYATAFGDDSEASGNASTAMGSAVTASGAEATAMGSGTEASGNSSTAFGDDTEASGFASTAMGRSTTASGGQSTAMGRETTAGGDFSLAAGRRAIVRDEDSGTFAWADNTVSDFISTGENQFLVRAAGGVGLGTNSPLAQLHVAKAINANAGLTTHVALIENTSTGTNGDVLVLKSGASTPAASNNFITFLNGADEFVGAIDGNGSGGVVYRTTGGDFAEMLPRLDTGETIAPGDVVGVVGGRITKATEGAEQVLVVTSRPAVLGNAHLDEAASHPVAFVGQVPVRVRGAVDIGDWIVPSGRDDGTAIAVAPETMRLADHAQVIGRAWEAAPGEESTLDTGEHRVTVAVGLDRVGALVERLQRQQMQIKTLRRQQTLQEDRLQAMEARLAAVEQSEAQR